MRHTLLGLVLGVATVALAHAQDSWHTHRGSNQRTGTTTNARDSIVNFLLSWTLPDIDSVRSPVVVDNDNAVLTSAIPPGDWKIPAQAEQASDPFRNNPNTTNPYQYALCVREPLNPDDPLPPFARFRWRSGALPPGYYRIFVYVPSADTRIGGQPAPYAQQAEYQVTDATGQTVTLYVNQTVGGWLPLGNRTFYHDGSTEIVVTLNNLIRRTSPDYTLGETPIVAADAVRFVPDYGTVQASPVAIRNPLDPNSHLVYIANGNGTITCVENPVTTRTARVRWTLRVPDLPDQGAGQIYDDDDPGFTAGIFTPDDALGDRYGRVYYVTEPTSDASNIQRAYWKVQVPTTGRYYVYAWFPSDAENARQAQYVIEHEDGFLRLRVDQRFGGRWVLLNNIPVEMRGGRTYEIEVNNFSPEDVSAGARRVIADAIRVVSAEGLENAVFSTPAVGRVRVRDGNSVVSRWVVVFAAQNGAVYAVDALGDGQNGTRPGETKIYWIVKPANSTSFSYASPLILEDENLVAIGNPAGSVYLIRTDLNPNDSDTYLRWRYDRVGAAFVSTPAYDPTNRLLYIGSSEGGNQYGRLIALKPFVDRDDPNTPQDERVAWVYPPETENPVEPITSTPAVALGRVYFTTGGLGGGRVYAVKAENGSLVWARPAINAPTIPSFTFFYSSPLVVENLLYRGNPTNVVYVGGALSRIVALNADTGELLHISENLGGQIFSSPVFTQVQPRDENGNPEDVARPAIVVATNNGLLLALYADEHTTPRDTKAFEGWDLYAQTVFASPAVLDGWLYAADDEGITYAYHLSGVANTGTELGGNIRPQPPIGGPQPDGSDYSKLRVSVTTRKEEADAVLNGTIRPDQLTPQYPDALEWGDTVYVVVWNFKQGSNPQPLRIQLIGPGITRVEYTLSPRQTNNPPRDNPDLDYVAVQSITIQSSGNNFYTPGEKYELQIRFGSSSWTSDLALETPGIDRPAAGGGLETPPYGGDDRDALTTGAGWRFGVANPLALSGIGEVGVGGTEQNLFNGNQGSRERFSVSTRFFNQQMQPIPVAMGEHGKSVAGEFFARDRRTPRTSEVAPISLNVRTYVDDLRWQGGPGAVVRALPWEILPSIAPPNRSPDYPDISGRRMRMLLDGAIDLQRAPGRITQGSKRVEVQIEIPRYQPANLTGYNSLTYVFVDSNNNGRFDGLESVLQPGVTQNLRIEAYREINTTTSVQVDEKMFVEEQTIDFGALPGGFGFNWGNLFANHPASAFQPDNPIFQPFWKTFTVRNEGNVNLYPVYLGKAFGSPTGTEYLFSDTVSIFAGMPVWTTVVSTLDPRFWPQPNPFYPGGNQPYPILQKPQVGDYAPTVLTQPAIPPRRDPTITVEPRKPLLSIAIPPFQPMGDYSQLIAPYQHNGGIPGVVNGTFAVPPMRVKVRVRETQLTGSTNRGVIPMIEGVPQPNAPRVSDITPAAFRDPATGRLHLYWASNRAAPDSRPNSFYLYKATLNSNLSGTMQDGVRATNGWQPESPNRWWGDLFGPYPNDPNGDLFVQALGLGRPLTSAEIATIKHHRPFIYLTGAGPFLFWTGEVLLRNRNYELLFYVRLNPLTGQPIGLPQAVALDPAVPRSSLAMAGVNGVGHWLFYVAAPSGRSNIFYIASEGDQFNRWRREQRLPLSPIVRSVESVSAAIYRVSANPLVNNEQFLYLADVFFIGTVGDRTESEILMQRFYLNPRNGTLVPLSDSNADDRLGITQTRFLPLVIDEKAQKDPNQNVWRVRHLDWAYLGRSWNSNPAAPDIDIKINGVSILYQRDPDNPSQFTLQTPTVDTQTGLMLFVYNEPVRNASGQIVSLLNKGRIVVDPTNGTVRFVNFAPRLNDIVTVTYRPCVYRVLSPALGSAGTYSQLRTVFQRTMNPRHTTNDLANSPVRRGERNGACGISDRPPVDRMWLIFRRSAPAPGSAGSFFFKTLRPGVRLSAPIQTIRGRVPVRTNAFILVPGENHVVVQLTPNNPPGAGLGFYEYDALRGNIYFSVEDLGKEIFVRYYTGDGREVTETLVVRWIDEGNLPLGVGTDVEYTSPIPIDLPANELSLWVMPNLEFRQQGVSLFEDPYGGLDESILLFWSSTRNGVGNLYGGAIQPRFYISPFDPDRD